MKRAFVVVVVSILGGGVLIWRTMPEPDLTDALWLSSGVGLFGTAFVLRVRAVLGIGTDLGSISVTRLGWAAERASAPVALVLSIAAVGAVGSAYHVPDRVTELLLYLLGVLIVLALMLALFGQPSFLLPADIRKHGPRTIWAPLRESRWGPIFASAFRRSAPTYDVEQPPRPLAAPRSTRRASATRRRLGDAADWIVVLTLLAIAYAICLGFAEVLGAVFGSSPRETPFALAWMVTSFVLVIVVAETTDGWRSRRTGRPEAIDEEDLPLDESAVPVDPQWQGARYCPQIGLLCLATFAVLWVVQSAFSVRSTLGETLVVGAACAVPGTLGVLMTALAIALPSGAARIAPEVPGSANPRVGRASIRAMVPLLLGPGVPLFGLSATMAWGAPFGTGYAWFGGVCAVLWCALFVVGQPAFLIPAELRARGPRTLWAPLPPITQYSRPGIPALERWLDARRASRGQSIPR